MDNLKPIKSFFKFLKKSKVKDKSNKNKIYLINQFIPPDFAATGQFIYDLGQSIKSQNTEIEIICCKPNRSFSKKAIQEIDKKTEIKITRLFALDIQINNILLKLIKGLFFSVQLIPILFTKVRSKDKLIFTTEPPWGILISFIFSKLKNISYLLIIYDFYPEILVHQGIIQKNNLIYKLWNIANEISIRNSINTIVLSEDMKSIVQNRYKSISEKLIVIPSWVDTKIMKKIPKKENPYIKKYKLKDKFIVLYSGNQGRLHDFNTIIKAAKILKNNKDIYFIFIGDGPKKEKIKSQIKSLNLKNFLLLPFQEKENLVFSLSIGDIAIVSQAANASGFTAPSKLYGHLSLSTPIAIISPHNSYLRKIVLEHNFGKWFINDNSIGLAKWIINLRKNKKYKLSMGEKGREFAIRYSDKSNVIESYKKILNLVD